MEAVARGHISRLLLNEPPRTGKTFIVSICFAAWTWAQRVKGPLMGPQVSFFYASYAEDLSHEHSVKCLRLIKSTWYQRRWGQRFTMIRETRGHLENSRGGYRMASSVDAKATGYGADIIIADDPHLVKEAESDDVRETTVKWWSESMPSRLNNRRTGAMIVIMQRVHEGDLSGHILNPKNGLDYVHFCVPMSYVPCFHANVWDGDKIKTIIGEDDVAEIDDENIFWVDQRTEDGELLWPERFPIEQVRILERELGPYAYAGQYQQEPAPRGGGVIKYDWWREWDEKAAKEHGTIPGQYPGFEYIIAALDTAYTEKEENDPSALSIWGIFRDEAGNPKIFLMYCWQEWLKFPDLVRRVADDCRGAPFDYKIKVDRLLIEDKAAGHSVIQELAQQFGHFDFGTEMIDPRKGFIKSPDKVARLLTVVHLFAEGLVYAPDKEWADDMKKQCATVPRAIHDDLADTCSMALIYLRRAGWALRKEEHAMIASNETRYRGRTQALYPV
jgi:predicted phage terminase large subunit-like protein